jgi:crotonobetainyl-CoA:carnitine CoA-transferase CaiB-like acyl-CoA transferase
MLSPYRVLDLGPERGLLCSQMLADLGADVIHLEPPSGSPARRQGPYAGDVEDPERSLTWWAWARNTRSVVLDPTAAQNRPRLLDLVRSADFLVESYAPGTMRAHGLDYEALAAVNPRLVYVSITPFGQDGPKATWRATDLTVLAAGGPLVLTGDADRPPVRLPVPQAFLHAAAEAAVAALIAHHERQRSGRGQHVDVSAQQAVALATQSYILCHPLGHPQVRRTAGGLRNGPIDVRMLFPARDGHVAVTFLFGSAIGPFSRRLMEYLYDEGACDAATRDKDWLRYSELLLSGEEPREEFERVKALIADFTAARSKQELLDVAMARGLLIAPVATVDEVLASPQLAARGYWHRHAAPTDGRPVTFPGPFARFSRTPVRYHRGPPRLGEHTAEVLAEARTLSGPPARPGPPDGPALAGVRIVDLMWVMAGPSATRVLADYGAEVVRIESTRRLDTARTLAPFHDNRPGAERSGVFQNLNTGKRMLTLDPTQPDGRAVLLDLVRRADVVTESFAPGTLERWRLGWEDLTAVKPDLVMLRTCLMGQTGPLATFAGYGNLAAAISGFSNLGGWPDRAPAGPFSAYTDYVSPRFVAAAILAALEHRDRTGDGQLIDLSQAEASLHFLGPALLDYTVNGRVATRIGNRDLVAAPHGVYPVVGEDRWIAIVAEDDADFATLCRHMERPDLPHAPDFATAAARRANGDALEAVVAAWTAAHDGHALEARLQAAGLAASLVQTSRDLWADPQLRHRGHFVRLSQAVHGEAVVEGSRFRLSRTPARIDGPAPSFGCDNEYVLRTLLGYDDTRITALVAAGVLA